MLGRFFTNVGRHLSVVESLQGLQRFIWKQVTQKCAAAAAYNTYGRWKCLEVVQCSPGFVRVEAEREAVLHALTYSSVK